MNKAWSHNNTSSNICCYKPWIYQHDGFCREKIFTYVCAKQPQLYMHTHTYVTHKCTATQIKRHVYKEVRGFMFNAGYMFAEGHWAGNESHFLCVTVKLTNSKRAIFWKYKQYTKNITADFFHKAVQMSTSLITLYHHLKTRVGARNRKDAFLL